MRIEILGTGCPKCKKLAENTENAVKELGIEAEVIKVTDIKEIMNYGVMTTPGLVVDGKVISAGKALNSDDIKKLISG